MSNRVVGHPPDLHNNTTNSSISSYSEFVLSLEIWKYGSPVLLTVGTVGNLLSILVLSRKRLRQVTTMFYLMVLAFADLAVLYTGLLRLWLDNVFEEYIRLQSDFACKFHTFFVYFALDFSVWTLVAVTVDRCVCVSAPFLARRWCTLRNARLVVAASLVADFLVNMHYLWTVDIIYQGTRSIAGDDRYTCYTSEDPDEAFFLQKVWPWLDFCVVCFLPFLMMLTGNCLIIRQIVLSARNLRAHSKPGKSDAAVRSLQEVSSKSAFSRGKSFVRRIRNRQVKAVDECQKNVVDEGTGRNPSLLDLPSSAVQVKSETDKSPVEERVKPRDTGTLASFDVSKSTLSNQSSDLVSPRQKPSEVSKCEFPSVEPSASGCGMRSQDLSTSSLSEGNHNLQQQPTQSVHQGIPQQLSKKPPRTSQEPSPGSSQERHALGNRVLDSAPTTSTFPSAPEEPRCEQTRARSDPRQGSQPNRRHPVTSDGARRRLCGIPSVTVMLLAVNSLFWLLTAPIVVFVIGYAYWLPGSSDQDKARLELGWAVVNMLQYTNNAVHFFLYCLTGPRFRQELVDMIRRARSVKTLSTVK